MKKIISIICVLVLSTSIPINALGMAQEEGELESVPLVMENEDDIDRWAVIIGTDCKWDNENVDSGCAASALAVYNPLIEDEKWKENHMKLLLDEEATKQDILNALDWLNNSADEDDIVLFFFCGHGGMVADEPPLDEWDRMDEVIGPWDCHRDENTGEVVNYISDDKLSEKFDNISENSVEGMFLIFECCYSGGLVDWRGTTSKASSTNEQSIAMLNQPLQETNSGFKIGLTSSEDLSTIVEIIESANNGLIEETNSITIESTSSEELLAIEEIIDIINNQVSEANNFSAELMTDIGIDNRVVLTDTIPHGLSGLIYSFINEDQVISVGAGIGKAIEKGKTTAEDIAQYAKWWFQSRLEVIIILLFYLNPFGLLEQILHIIFDGAILMLWPIWRDGYPADDPSSAKLPIMGDDDGISQSNPQSNSQPTTPASTPSSSPTNS